MASDDLLRVCYTHEVGMQHLDPDRLPFACANCGEDSAEVNRLQALVSEQAREIERLTGEVVRAHYTLAESDCVCERCVQAMDMLGASLAARGEQGGGTDG